MDRRALIKALDDSWFTLMKERAQHTSSLRKPYKRKFLEPLDRKIASINARMRLNAKLIQSEELAYSKAFLPTGERREAFAKFGGRIKAWS